LFVVLGDNRLPMQSKRLDVPCRQIYNDEGDRTKPGNSDIDLLLENKVQNRVRVRDYGLVIGIWLEIDLIKVKVTFKVRVMG